MNEDEFWPRLYKAFEHTDVDWEKFWLGDEFGLYSGDDPGTKEGVMYIKFTNVQKSKEADDVDM